MRLEIFHNKNFLDFNKFAYKNTDIVYLPREDFNHVCTIADANELSDGFSLTQNIDESWCDNPDILPTTYGKNHPRSTSVGDVVVKIEDGIPEYCIVMPIGYKKFKFLFSPQQCYETLKERLNEENFRIVVKYIAEHIEEFSKWWRNKK